MTRLDQSAGGFLIHHLIVYLTLVMQAFFRAFELIFRDFDAASRISVNLLSHILRHSGAWVPLAFLDCELLRWSRLRFPHGLRFSLAALH